MAWQTVAKAKNLKELEEIAPAVTFAHDEKFRIVIELPWWAPVAPIFDAVGAEWAVDMFYDQAGAILEDVEGVGAHKVVLHFKANAVQLAVLIPVLILVLGTVAALVIAAVSIDRWLPPAIGAAMWPLAIAGGVLGVVWVLASKGERKPRPP